MMEKKNNDIQIGRVGWEGVHQSYVVGTDKDEILADQMRELA